MSKTTDKKIKELSKKHSTDEKVKYDCTAWDEGQVCCTEKDWFKSWLQQALSEVERESFEGIKEFAIKQCDSFELVGIHRCSAGHCGRCGECDVLSSLLLKLGGELK